MGCSFNFFFLLSYVSTLTKVPPFSLFSDSLFPAFSRVPFSVSRPGTVVFVTMLGNDAFPDAIPND